MLRIAALFPFLLVVASAQWNFAGYVRGPLDEEYEMRGPSYDNPPPVTQSYGTTVGMVFLHVGIGGLVVAAIVCYFKFQLNIYTLIGKNFKFLEEKRHNIKWPQHLSLIMDEYIAAKAMTKVQIRKIHQRWLQNPKDWGAY